LRPAQQSAFAVHTCPYCAQFVAPPPPPPPPVPPPVAPPSDPPPAGAPHVPLLLPAGITHGEPAQQSAVVVHAPPAAMHFVAPHTNGGEPAGLGTQGLSQQSALDAHAVPGGGGPFVVQS
jgi:hypothetical protein